MSDDEVDVLTKSKIDKLSLAYNGDNSLND